jgi:hypothetical protein
LKKRAQIIQELEHGIIYEPLKGYIALAWSRVWHSSNFFLRDLHHRLVEQSEILGVPWNAKLDQLIEIFWSKCEQTRLDRKGIIIIIINRNMQGTERPCMESTGFLGLIFQFRLWYHLSANAL